MKVLPSLKKLFLAAALTIATPIAAWAGMKPFILGSGVADVPAAEAALTSAGFEIVGTYSPSADTTVLVVTNDKLKALAGQSKNGGFGAMERVALVKKGGGMEVSYTNPEYQFNAYRMKGDISPIAAAMAKALGNQKQFGSDKEMDADDLRDYHYKMLMPYFDYEDELASFGSYKEAVASVEAGLKAKRAGSEKVYRIDIPGKEMTVFGVALNYKNASDKFILEQINKNPSHAAHFPYEILVVGDEAIALNAKFRIAINWPSLSMMGSGSFMSISASPDEIKEALKAVATNSKAGSGSDSDF